MIDLTPDRIREVCRAALLTGALGRINERDMPTRAVVDSRLAREGDLFVGIKGDRVDGGAFAEQAVEAGCWGALLAPEHALRLAAIAHPNRKGAVMYADAIKEQAQTFIHSPGWLRSQAVSATASQQ